MIVSNCPFTRHCPAVSVWPCESVEPPHVGVAAGAGPTGSEAGVGAVLLGVVVLGAVVLGAVVLVVGTGVVVVGVADTPAVVAPDVVVGLAGIAAALAVVVAATMTMAASPEIRAHRHAVPARVGPQCPRLRIRLFDLGPPCSSSVEKCGKKIHFLKL
jgi:hypothetical protein